MGEIEKRNITKEDILLEARLLSEGVRITTKNPPKIPPPFPGTVILDGCEITTLVRPGRYARMEAEFDDDKVTISDMGKVLGTATHEKRPEWFDIPLSNGKPAWSALRGMTPDLIAIITNHLCYNSASGQGCKYCGLFPANYRPPRSRDWSRESYDKLKKRGKYAAEAVKLAVDHGWRGKIDFSGGVLPPKQRKELTQRLEILITPLREALGDDVLSKMQVASNSYPPDDMADLYKWKDLGLNSVQFDLEVLDPAYFAAICPAKHAAHPLEYWKEAQEAAVEVFGRWRGCATSIVMGIEPMNSLVEGVEERLSKGVCSTPLCFQPTPGSAYEKFNPPTAEWIVEANEKMAESYLRLEGTLDKPLFDDDRPGYTRTGRSYDILMLTDELWRRGQEMGKMPPGLPIQGT